MCLPSFLIVGFLFGMGVIYATDTYQDPLVPPKIVRHIPEPPPINAGSPTYFGEKSKLPQPIPEKHDRGEMRDYLLDHPLLLERDHRPGGFDALDEPDSHPFPPEALKKVREKLIAGTF